MSDNPLPRYIQVAGLDLINARVELGYRVIQACFHEDYWLALMALEEADAPDASTTPPDGFDTPCPGWEPKP